MDTIPAAAISASGSNYIRFSNGVQICWGGQSARLNSAAMPRWTFGQPFKDTNYGLGVSGNYDWMNAVKTRTTTYFIPGDGTIYSGTYVCYYVSVGLWK